ncbi:MAG: hypothetical protein ABIB71_05495, partial [Candidatus Woesearchaeota archaeon]
MRSETRQELEDAENKIRYIKALAQTQAYDLSMAEKFRQREMEYMMKHPESINKNNAEAKDDALAAKGYLEEPPKPAEKLDILTEELYIDNVQHGSFAFGHFMAGKELVINHGLTYVVASD